MPRKTRKKSLLGPTTPVLTREFPVIHPTPGTTLVNCSAVEPDHQDQSPQAFGPAEQQNKRKHCLQATRCRSAHFPRNTAATNGTRHVIAPGLSTFTDLREAHKSLAGQWMLRHSPQGVRGTLCSGMPFDSVTSAGALWCACSRRTDGASCVETLSCRGRRDHVRITPADRTNHPRGRTNCCHTGSRSVPHSSVRPVGDSQDKAFPHLHAGCSPRSGYTACDM